jgi:hypothetical protein
MHRNLAMLICGMIASWISADAAEVNNAERRAGGASQSVFSNGKQREHHGSRN